MIPVEAVEAAGVPYEALVAASRAIDDNAYALLGWEGITRLLEVAAPYIRAQALEDAADEFENLPANKGAEISSGTYDWFELFPITHIRERAAAERGGE